MIYIASPYSSISSVIRQVRYMQVMRYTFHCIEAGEHVFSPIVYAHHMAKDLGAGTDHETWKNMNEHYMTMCSSARVLMLTQWEKSKGIMEHELPFLEKLDKPVEFIKPC